MHLCADLMKQKAGLKMTNDTMPEEIWASEFDESRQIGVAFALRENEICRTKYIRADLYEGAVERHNHRS